MSTLAWIATVIFVGIPWAVGLYFFAEPSVRRYLRKRKAEHVEPSPLMHEVQGWLAARERTFRRQSIFETPTGRTRLGINAPAPRTRRPGA